MELVSQAWSKWAMQCFSQWFHNVVVLVERPLNYASSGSLSITDNRDGRKYDIPITNNAVKATDLRNIAATGSFDPLTRWERGLQVVDPGFQNTAVKTSQITRVDGVGGMIYYRGIPITQLFDNHDYEEIAYLLVWGPLPNVDEKLKFRRGLNSHLNAPPAVINAIKQLPRTSPPFAMILAGLAAYNAVQPENNPTAAGNPKMYSGRMDAADAALIRTIASMAVCVTMTYCHRRGHDLGQADPDAPFVSNVLRLMGFFEGKSDAWNDRVSATLGRIWILYADHELTNSTAAFLHVASTLADPISCCSALIASGNGPLHAGAVDLAYQSLERIGSPENVPKMIADVKAKKYRLFGYGHRIYKTVDPRIGFIRGVLDEYASGSKDPLLRVAMEIDRIASEDEYFTSRNLKANADLYGCFAYSSLGIEQDGITALMMLSRMPGVVAHWREAMSQQNPLWRPQQVYAPPTST